MQQLPNIKYKKTKTNPTLDAETSPYELPFYKDAEYLSNLENLTGFITAVKAMVRSSPYYKRYIKYLKEDVGLNFCQVLSGVKSEDETSKTKIEMHHGPILSMFDYITIITDYMLSKGEPITTFSVANRVIEEHYALRIQTVMLSETVHEEVHEKEIFINMAQGFGDINAFLEIYHDGLSEEMIQKINNYIKRSESNDSYDKGVLTLKENLTDWSR